jgi:hypothetical protein
MRGIDGAGVRRGSKSRRGARAVVIVVTTRRATGPTLGLLLRRPGAVQRTWARRAAGEAARARSPRAGLATGWIIDLVNEWDR